MHGVDGGHERRLCRFLEREGVRFSVSNPVSVRRYAQGMGMLHKTDRLDARVLAEYCRLRRPEPSALEGDSRSELRALEMLRQGLQEQLLQLKAKHRAPLLPESAEEVMEMAERGISDSMELLERRIQQVLDCSPDIARDVELLCTIPGVARRSALKILSCLPEGGARSARGLAAYAGLVPAIRESGSSLRKRPRIADACSRRLRSTLFMCGMVARQNCPRLRDFALELQAKGKAKLQAIVAVMRKLAHAIYAVLATKKPYDPLKIRPMRA